MSKEIDKAAGAKREIAAPDSRSATRPHVADQSGGKAYPLKGDASRTLPATEGAARWRGWGSALKPSHEPICVARKPLSEQNVAAQVLATGTGALNIDDCRIGTRGGTRQVVAKDAPTGREVTGYGTSIGSAPGGNVEIGGRWPANVVLVHSPDCKGSGPTNTEVLCLPGCPVAELNEQSGTLTTGSGNRSSNNRGVFGDGFTGKDAVLFVLGSSGGASRFFYVAKAKRRERIGGTIRNLHPTCKPVELMRWLVRLVTPPDGIVLDPFLGSGSTGCAAIAEGFRFVGIEREQESYETALARISDWAFAHNQPRPITE